MSNIKRALVGSGGGDKGARSGAQYQCLHEHHNRVYDIYVATSTNSLIQSLAPLGQFGRIYDAYTTTRRNDVIEMHVLKRLYHYIIGSGKSETFGDSEPLRQRIEKYFTDFEYEKLKNLEATKGLIVESAVTNGITAKTEYYGLAESYQDFCDWMLASSSVVPFMSQVHKNGAVYADGGFSEHAPVQRAIDLGADIVDVVILRTDNFSFDPSIDIKKHFRRRPFRTLSHWIDVALHNLNVVDIANLKAVDKEVEVNIYYSNPKYNHNSLSFDREDMKRDWEQGYEDMKVEKNKTTFILRPNTP